MDDSKASKAADKWAAARARYEATGCCGYQDQVIHIDGVDVDEDGNEFGYWNRVACQWSPTGTCEVLQDAKLFEFFSLFTPGDIDNGTDKGNDSPAEGPPGPDGQ